MPNSTNVYTVWGQYVRNHSVTELVGSVDAALSPEEIGPELTRRFKEKFPDIVVDQITLKTKPLWELDTDEIIAGPGDRVIGDMNDLAARAFAARLFGCLSEGKTVQQACEAAIEDVPDNWREIVRAYLNIVKGKEVVVDQGVAP